MAGRMSAEALALEGAASLDRKIQAPSNLTPGERKLWDKVVGEKPADWFTRDNIQLMIVYCRCATQLDWMADRIENLKKAIESAEVTEDLEALGQALMNLQRFQAMEDKYSRNLLAVATKLRMTPQAQISAPAAGTRVKKNGEKTWDAGVENPEDLMKEIKDDEVGEAGLGLMN